MPPVPADVPRLQYRRARYYDPLVGQFTQIDPIGMRGGLNLYGYANSDPVNFRDPSGLCPSCDRRADAAADVGRGLGEMIGALGDFLRNYRGMIDADTTGSDKYFHCRANFEGASRGEYGAFASGIISTGREFSDMARGTSSSGESTEDAEANQAGRAAAAEGVTDPDVACGDFWPGGSN